MLEFIKNYLTEFFSESFANIDFSVLSITGISFLDIVDILIVAYFIYKIILWIKETRAWALFKGVLVVLALSFAALFFRLTTITWLLKSAVSMGIIAIIILFQPELRKALEQLGKGRLTMPFGLVMENGNQVISPKTVDEVLKACYAMAKVRTGALILLEDEVALGDLEQTGIALDATVSAALLINIFEDKTPLHDGAVIIRSNRIAAASCILPLTQDEIGKELGTRHRAAVGASEVSDAFVIVVSEETGTISVARGGRIYRNQSLDEIRRMILTEEEADKRKFVFRKGSKEK